MSSAETENLGLPLKKAREHLGLSINDVAVATKINPRILKALEEGQRELLPAKSFARGFIRTYAAYLKIDSKPILDAYEGIVGAELKPPVDATKNEKPTSTDEDDHEAVTKVESKPSPIKKSGSAYSESSSSSKVIMIGSILLLVALIIGIKKVVDKYAHERSVEAVAILPAALPVPIPTGTEAVKPTATGTPLAVASPTGSAAIGDEDTDDSDVAAVANKEAAAVAPTATPSPSVTAALAKAPEPEKKPNLVAVKPSPPGAPIKAAPTTVEKDEETAAPEAAKTSKPQEVIIEALDTVDVTIQVDNDPAKTVKLTPESIHTIKAKSQIELEIADGGMVNLIYNGHERGVPGVLGKPVKIKFPQ